ncbi:MAG: adenosylcobinamide amidohydrolase [Dissulfurispiraceae bacterium]
MKKLIVLIMIFLLIPAMVLAVDIPLPLGLKATASVIKAERDGFWEKTLIVRFPEQRRTLSTTDGFVDAMAAMNHAADPLLWEKLGKECTTTDSCSGKEYVMQVQEKIAKVLGLKSTDLAQMATAADMDNLAVVTKEYKPFVVTALVTAGAKTNAIRTGVDEGKNIEGAEPHGTVNIMILTNARLTDGAMARAIVTVTEAKTAAFEDLKIPSTYTKTVQATGTGTDSVIVVSGINGPKVTYTGGHSRIGELIGKAVYEAVVEALGKQNGFKKSDK